MPALKASSIIFFSGLGRYGFARPETACLTQRTCNKRRQQLAFDHFYVGDYTVKGCFAKRGIAYFGIGGDEDDMSAPPRPGERRIWCTESRSPTKAPTTKPLQTATIASGDSPGDECIDVQVNTGKFEEVGFKLSTKTADGSASEVLDYPAGSLGPEREYAERVCVQKGAYTFTADGKSSYSIWVNDEEVLFGSNSRGETNAFDITVGHRPALDDLEKAWLDGHNTRREEFHKSYDRKYRPLHWSQKLAKDASNWVDKMLPLCKFFREPNLEEGENISIHKYSGASGPSDIQIPEKILANWSDKKLQRDYPNNQSMTQVMWRGTRYLGCANKSSKNDDGVCIISICRYSRTGNCNMSSENWLDVTLNDHSLCGKSCPEDGCH